jgi:hypothetical protein
MAQVGIGFRSVFEMLVEISLALIEPVSFTTLSALVTPGIQTVSLGSTANLLQGCSIVIDPGTPAEEAIYLSSVTSTQIQALFANSHAAGAIVLGACFPTQQATDPFYTQYEIISYISRAQNEFLARVPCFYAFAYSQIKYGQILQSLPCTPIELIRVAFSPTNVAIVSLTRTSGSVDVVTTDPHGLSVGSKFSIINALPGASLTLFNGAFKAATIISPTEFTYLQGGVINDTSTGGTVSLWTRLKEATQEMLTLTNPGWQSQYQQIPRSWFEDRTGSYTYGIDSRPVATFPTELLMSIRDDDSLGILDGFRVPDIMLHYVKYRALQFAWEKDGENRNPEMAKFCNMRFERGILASLRWLDAMMGKDAMAASQVKQRARA